MKSRRGTFGGENREKRKGGKNSQNKLEVRKKRDGGIFFHSIDGDLVAVTAKPIEFDPKGTFEVYEL